MSFKRTKLDFEGDHSRSFFPKEDSGYFTKTDSCDVVLQEEQETLEGIEEICETTPKKLPAGFHNLLTKSIGQPENFFHGETAIKGAVQRACTEDNLVGDFSRSLSLPLLQTGYNQDVNAISSNTLNDLILGKYNVLSYGIIDCRYPYEYSGGHIKGSINIYQQKDCLDFLNNSNADSPKILIFHCEFSQKRGPDMYRYLRGQDRIKNMSLYPILHYPEMYVLEGGYKKFFQEFPESCQPQNYVPMLENEFSQELKFFHSKKNGKKRVL